jgi:hypothetical protein
MALAIQIIFNHKADFYSAFVTIMHEFETDFIDIEFLDHDMIEIMNAPCLSYVGEGYKRLPVYRSVRTRPLFNSICQIIKQAQFICNEYVNRITDEERIRQN